MMLVPPLAHIETIDRAALNRCLVDWGHRMGPYTRPSYAIEAHHALFAHGAPIAVSAAAETVREVVGQTGLRRDEVIELARMCACRPDLNRVMIRLWRELIFPAIAEAHGRPIAVSYQDKTLHTGNLYRFDGWHLIGNAGGGGADTRTGRPGRKMQIWAWSHDAAQLDRLRDLSAERRERFHGKALAA